MPHLTKEQKKVIETWKNNLSIIAGAGTGKTFTLVEKIKYGLENNIINEHNVLVLTFTRNAVEELKERIGNPNVTVHTFHSLMYEMYRKAIQKNIPIILDSNKNIIIKKIVNKLKKNQPKLVSIDLPIKKIIERIDIIINDYNDIENDIIVSEYINELENLGVTDFSTVQYFAIKYFENVKHLYDRFTDIFVDEFQDTSMIQLELLKKFKMTKDRYFYFIGDPRQSIYQWRGAYPFIFDDVVKYFNTKILNLSYSFRNPNNVLQIANLVHNGYKPLKSAKNYDGEILLFRSHNASIEAYTIINHIANLLGEGYNYEDIAILYRKNFIGKYLESYLIQHEIPYKIYNGVSFFNRMEIKSFINFLYLLMSPTDYSAFLYIKDLYGIKGIGVKSLENKNVIDYLKNKKKTTQEIINFINYYEKALSYYNNENLEGVYDVFLSSIDFMNQFKEEEERIQNLMLLKTFISKNNSIDKFMEFILASNAMAEKTDGNHIKLMSIHAAKGLEFPIVFLVGLEDTILPDNYNDNENEEDNLFYVAITRTKEKLYMFYSAQRYNYEVITLYPSKYVTFLRKNNIQSFN